MVACLQICFSRSARVLSSDGRAAAAACRAAGRVEGSGGSSGAAPARGPLPSWGAWPLPPLGTVKGNGGGTKGGAA